MWDLHDRLGEHIDNTTCGALIESMEKHGQHHPVLGRAISSAEGYDVELIYGARRLFAARQLGIQLLVDLQAIDDREAIVEMDIENRGRQDISPYERGLSYARWLRAGVFHTQTEIAQVLGVSEAQISRLLRYAVLPAVVVGAFRFGSDIREEWAGNLAKYCEDKDARERLIKRARQYAESGRKEAPRCVYDALVRDEDRKLVKFKRRDEVVKDSTGAPIMRLQFRAKSVHLVLPRADLELSVLREAVKALVTVLETRARPAEMRQRG
jgi:ParB family chromosome partitioning protein